MAGFDKKASDHIPWAKDQGHDYLVGSNAQNAMQAGLVTQVGLAPFTVDLEAEGFKRMKDANYTVIVQIEGATATVDESTKTSGSFDVLGGADTNVLNLLIIGRTADQPDG